jgi:heptosyltransferase-2
VASLVIQTSFLGDVVLTTPLLDELASSGRGPVTVVTTPAAAPLIERHPAVAQVVPYDKRGGDRGPRGFGRLVARVRAGSDDDVAYLAQGSHRSALLARAAGYARRIGFSTSAGRVWYTQRVTPRPGWHHAERLWRLAAGDAAPAIPLRPSLAPTAAHESEVDTWLAPHRALGETLIGLAPGSVWATKRWPHYPQLARELVALGRLVVVGAGADQELAREIVAAVPEALDAAGHLSLLGSAVLIGRCRVLVTNDSLPLHLASAMNTPTVALFGPTVPAFGFGPLAGRHATPGIEGLTCRPCHTHGPRTCPEAHFRCMRDLLPDRVASVVRTLTA